MDKTLQQAIEYFSDPAFARLLRAMSQRYRNLGRVGGSVRLERVTAVERQALARVLGRDLGDRDNITIRLVDLQAAIAKTRFAGIDLVAILEGVTGKPLVTRAEAQQKLASRKDAFFTSLLAQHGDSLCQLWLEHMRDNELAWRGIYRALLADPKLLATELNDVLRALASLPSRAGMVKRLPVWATEVTGDPHAFDTRSNRGKYLLQALQFHSAAPDDNASSTEAQTALLESFGLVRDDILNFVTCAGLVAENAVGEPAPLWQAAYQGSSVLNLPVRELSRVSRIYPAGEGQCVFVVENSGVFSDLLDNFPGLLPPLVCTHGQFKLASYLLLDKLVAAGTIVFYSGDHDPEGILMAQRLYERYAQSVRAWRFTEADYALTVSDAEISERRLKQLHRVTAPELQGITAVVKQHGKVGYQEKLQSLLLQDMKSASKKLFRP